MAIFVQRAGRAGHSGGPRHHSLLGSPGPGRYFVVQVAAQYAQHVGQWKHQRPNKSKDENKSSIGNRILANGLGGRRDAQLTDHQATSVQTTLELSMPQSLYYDPAQVTYYEKAGWEAYYDRNWTASFWLLVQLNRALFGMPWFTAVSAALDTVHASRIFLLHTMTCPRHKPILPAFMPRHGAMPVYKPMPKRWPDWKWTIGSCIESLPSAASKIRPMTT